MPMHKIILHQEAGEEYGLEQAYPSLDFQEDPSLDFYEAKQGNEMVPEHELWKRGFAVGEILFLSSIFILSARNENAIPQDLPASRKSL